MSGIMPFGYGRLSVAPVGTDPRDEAAFIEIGLADSGGVALHENSRRSWWSWGPWEWVEVELSVPARRVGSLEQRNSHATHAQRGEPPAGAQP